MLRGRFRKGGREALWGAVRDQGGEVEGGCGGSRGPIFSNKFLFIIKINISFNTLGFQFVFL